jgi:hypothetical protein
MLLPNSLLPHVDVSAIEQIALAALTVVGGPGVFNEDVDQFASGRQFHSLLGRNLPGFVRHPVSYGTHLTASFSS